jgi:hypothetical protein
VRFGANERTVVDSTVAHGGEELIGVGTERTASGREGCDAWRFTRSRWRSDAPVDVPILACSAPELRGGSLPRMSACCRLVVLALLVAACTSRLPRRGTDGATVSIGQPTVYLRERSLIERFEDLEWLRAQRSPQMEKEYEQGFQGSVRTATSEMTGFALKAAIGQVLAGEADAPPPAEDPAEPGPEPTAPSTTADESGGGEANGEGGGGEPSPASSLDAFAKLRELDDAALGDAFKELNKSVPSLSPRDKLVNRIAFRDTVSEAIRQRSLDDVHDLEGNALYELQFDLSIVSGDNPGQAYAVMLEIAAVSPKDLELDLATRERVVQTLQAACLAEIEEKTARYREGWLTAHDSPYVQEAELRGVVAARHAELISFQRELLAAENKQKELWSRLRTVAYPAGRSAAELSAGWTAWDGSHLPEEEFRDRIVTGTDERVVLANQDVTRFLSEGRRHLGRLIERQRGLLAELDGGTVETGSAKLEKQQRITTADRERVLDLVQQEDEAGVRTFLAPIPIEGPPARSPREEERLRELFTELARLALDERGAGELLDLLQEPSSSSIRRYTLRSLGFVIARNHARYSGGIFEYDDAVAPHGLDARALLSLLLKRRVGKWDLPQATPPRVVRVTPDELAEQTTTSAHSAIQSAFSLALDALFRGTLTGANAAFDRVSQELRRYELIGRNPLLVGFVGGDVGGKTMNRSNSFGWIIGPRLETSAAGRADLRYRHISGHNSVSATLIAPATLARLELRYKVFRIGATGEWLECRPVPSPAETMRQVPFPLGAPPRVRGEANTISLQLPTSPEVIAQGLLARNRWSETEPQVFAARPPKRRDEREDDGVERRAVWHLQAEEKGALTILGRNLWRNPQVYAGGQRASRVHILSDLGGLWAEFDKVGAPPGLGVEPVRVDLIVSTSRGSDVILEGIEVLPPRKQTKPTEPQFGPAMQVVVPAIQEKKVGDKTLYETRFGMRFELAPPLPKTWNELRLRARPLNAAAYVFDIEIQAGQLIQDPKKLGGFEIREVLLVQEQRWSPTAVLEVMLQVREKQSDDLRSVHPTPIEVALVQVPIACQSVGTVVQAELRQDKWVLAEKRVVPLSADAPLSPAHAEQLSPELKPGLWAEARVHVGSTVHAARLAAKEGEVGRTWSLELPGSIPLTAGKDLPAQPVTFRVTLGRAEWTVPLRLEAKPTSP